MYHVSMIICMNFTKLHTYTTEHDGIRWNIASHLKPHPFDFNIEPLLTLGQLHFLTGWGFNKISNWTSTEGTGNLN